MRDEVLVEVVSAAVAAACVVGAEDVAGCTEVGVDADGGGVGDVGATAAEAVLEATLASAANTGNAGWMTKNVNKSATTKRVRRSSKTIR